MFRVIDEGSQVDPLDEAYWGRLARAGDVEELNKLHGDLSRSRRAILEDYIERNYQSVYFLWDTERFIRRSKMETETTEVRDLTIYKTTNWGSTCFHIEDKSLKATINEGNPRKEIEVDGEIYNYEYDFEYIKKNYPNLLKNKIRSLIIK